MPQIEKVIQIKIRMLEGGHPNGVNHERKTGPPGRRLHPSAPRTLQDKRMEIFILLFWAHFRREAPETTPKHARETLSVSILTR
jgi:hypothetical protein